MSIWGDQWICLCGWHNVFVRKNCRHCNGPRPLAAVATESAMDVMRRLSTPPQAQGDRNGK